MDRIKVCVEEATGPAAAAAASNGSHSRPGSPPLQPADPGSSSQKKKKGKRSADSDQSRAGASDAQCNWALAHAACRVCRVVGRTFQKAIRLVWCYCWWWPGAEGWGEGGGVGG